MQGVRRADGGICAAVSPSAAPTPDLGGGPCWPARAGRLERAAVQLARMCLHCGGRGAGPQGAARPAPETGLLWRACPVLGSSGLRLRQPGGFVAGHLGACCWLREMSCVGPPERLHTFCCDFWGALCSTCRHRGAWCVTPWTAGLYYERQKVHRELSSALGMLHNGHCAPGGRAGVSRTPHRPRGQPQPSVSGTCASCGGQPGAWYCAGCKLRHHGS